MVADADEVRAGMPVVDLQALERPGGDLEDRRIGSEAGDALADDDAFAHGVQRRPPGSGVIDALIDGSVRDVLAWKGKRDAVREDVHGRL